MDTKYIVDFCIQQTDNLLTLMLLINGFIFLFFAFCLGFLKNKINKVRKDSKEEIDDLNLYIERIRKANLKKKSDEKLILPPRFPRNKKQTY